MLACDIDPASLRCRVCGARVTKTGVSRNCRPPAGLGDYVAAGLSAVGITSDRVEALVGGPCGCDERQKALNEWGRNTLGIGRVDPPT